MQFYKDSYNLWHVGDDILPTGSLFIKVIDANNVALIRNTASGDTVSTVYSGAIAGLADGIPIGNYLSQWLANVYLAYFDHYCKEILLCRYYYRYCDDIVILGNNKEKLHYICNEIRKYMINKLNVSIKDNYQIFPIDRRGIDFLGYRFFHGYILVRKRIVKDMKRARSTQSKMSYYGWLCHADSYRLIKKYYGNEEVRRFCKRGA